MTQAASLISDDSPPKPRLTFRVGVVGHRPNRLDPSKASELRDIIRRLLEATRDEVLKFGRANEMWFERDANREATLRMISSLAEGTDREAAEIALDLGFELQVPMPFFREEFENDFKPPRALAPDSVAQFERILGRASQSGSLVTFEMDGSRANEAAAYSAAGRVVLNQSDILLAVWDGQGSQEQGGTLETLYSAIKYQVPVIWIDALDPRCWQVVTSHRELERLETSGRCAPELPESGVGALRDQIQRTLSLDGTSASPPDDSQLESKKLESFFIERTPPSNLAILWKLFRDILGTEKVSALNVDPQTSAGLHANNRAERQAGFERMIDVRLRRFYDRSDRLAVAYSDLYRSLFVLTFLLSPIAIVFSKLSTAAGWPSAAERLCITIELAITLFILLLIQWGRKGNWHQRWLDYRLLAELMRQIRLLAPIGGGRPFPRLPLHLSSYGDPARSWMYWCVRSIDRQIGLPSARIDQKYLQDYESFLAKELDEQIRFHDENRARAERIGHRLRRLAIAMYVVTVLACCLHLLIDFLPDPVGGEWPARWAIFLAAILPAFGGAFAAIGAQAEFHRLEMRSGAMVEYLRQIQSESQLVEPNGGGSVRPHLLSLARLSRIGMQVTQLMVDEVLDWRIVFLDRPLKVRG